VVLPCFDEAPIIQTCVQRIVTVCDNLSVSFEVLLVDDGSRDDTWAIIRALAATDLRIAGIRLSRNHGHQLALTAGLTMARGERVFMLDADLQDPPELLPEMMKAMDEGVHVAFGQRRSRTGDPRWKRWVTRGFYRLLGWVAESPVALDAGDFRLVSRRALDLVLDMPERHRFLRGMFGWIGLAQVAIPYDRGPRSAGASGYGLDKLLRLAIDGLTALSIRPLRLATVLGLVTGGFGAILLMYSLASKVVSAPAGWSSLMAAIAVLGSVQLIMLGIIGEYLGRLYDQSLGRPLFIIDEMVGRPHA
jgi:dolichol-phosphate mannosyltransferase